MFSHTRDFIQETISGHERRTCRQIEFEPKDGVDIFNYSDLTLSALCGIDLDLESVVV